MYYFYSSAPTFRIAFAFIVQIYIHLMESTTTPEMIMLLLALFTLLAASAESAVVYPQVRQNPLMCVLRASLLQPDSLCIWLCVWLLLICHR